MMRSLFSGVSGLKNHQTRMDVIGNNISNVNTTGYKSSRVNFTDMLSQNLQGASSPNANIGGTNPKQIGLGSAVGAVDMLFTNGSVQSTGVNTDLALSSTNALFILNTGKGTAYTRNGDFQFDADGNYVQAGNGYFVQGWMANDKGSIDTNKGVQNITIPSGKTMSPAASTIANYTNNLNAEVPVITKIVGGETSTYDSGTFTATEDIPLTLALSDGSEVQVTEGTYTVNDAYSTSTVYHTDSGDSVVVSDDNSPVTAELKGDLSVDASDPNSGWKFGYTTHETGKSDTASATKTITVKSADGKKSATGTSGTTYTVGQTYEGDKVTEKGKSVTTTSDAANNFVRLYLADGSTHDVSATSATYTVGVDTYSYPGGGPPSLVTGYAQGFVIDSLTALSTAGTGATVTVDGIASRTVSKEGESATASADNTVTLKLANGESVTGTSGETYTVGEDSVGAEVTTLGEPTGAASSTNRVHLRLEDGTTKDDDSSGTSYTVGESYTYTKNKTTTEGDSLTASGEDPVTITLKNGEEITSTSGTFTVGEDFTYDTGTTYDNTGDTSNPAGSDNRVVIYIQGESDPITDDSSGNTYTVGDEYPSAGSGRIIEKFEQWVSTTSPIDGLRIDETTKIAGFSKISKVESITEERVIEQVEETAKTTISSISPPGTKASSDKPVTLTLSDGSTLVQTSGSYEVGHSTPIVTTLAVYDTLGSVHDLPVYFTLTDAAQDTWSVALTIDGSTTTSWTEADGSTTTVSMDPVKLDFDTNGAFASGTGTTTLTLTNGSTTPQTVQMDFTKLTQYSSSSTIAGKADGNASGTLSSISIDKTGTITGTYTNGMKKVEAQVALQRFNNPGGLNKVGESLYEDSNNAGLSGSPNTASALGATITPAALEMSNVDIANEFTDMIITQRGFQGNSKIITVSDEMLETLINMKR